ncbi:transposase [Brucella vulpis]|nr:transposase [Brucella vulpis]CUW49064.1 transposase [Brucella vulpis]
MLHAFPKAKALLADKGYDADWFRDALAERKITACIPSRANRKDVIPYDPALYKRRHKIENMFGRLKDWRRIHTRYDRCALTPSSQAYASLLPLPSSRSTLISMS